jgi:hypothetical protein
MPSIYLSILLTAALLTYSFTCALLDHWIQTSIGFLLALACCFYILSRDTPTPNATPSLESPGDPSLVFAYSFLVVFAVVIIGIVISSWIGSKK